jgi:hypothetical protein
MTFNLADQLKCLEPEEYLKFCYEITANSGEAGINDEEADRALRRLDDWLAVANFIRFWRDGQVTMKWRPDLRDLVVRAVEDPL